MAAALERIGEKGKLIHVYQTGNPQTQGLNAMNFSQEIINNLATLNISHLRSLEQGHDIAQMHQVRTAALKFMAPDKFSSF